ncbi:MAG TPA: helix-turn-helix domain-containing protein [Acidimicrobiia bacterium]|nr:helix-turn-helix domain-containing protein [Acidimicrobiia bacterium]
MTADAVTPVLTSWAERVADRSEAVQRSRTRQIEQAHAIVAAARRLIIERGDQFTTQELVKEAGVALQTFYRIFGGKDQLLLAVFEDLIAESCADYEQAAEALPDPIARLHFYVSVTVGGDAEESYGIGPRFVTAEHWRLHQLFPEEMTHATQHFTDMVQRQLALAVEEGLASSTDVPGDSWLITKLVMATFHHYAYSEVPTDRTVIAEELWSFCRRAIGGTESQ